MGIIFFQAAQKHNYVSLYLHVHIEVERDTGKEGKAGGTTQWGEHLPSVVKALGSTRSHLLHP